MNIWSGMVWLGLYYEDEQNSGMISEPCLQQPVPAGGFQNTGMETNKETPVKSISSHAALFRASCTPSHPAGSTLLTGCRNASAVTTQRLWCRCGHVSHLTEVEMTDDLIQLNVLE